jgi:RNA polymerase sigma-70 factor (ECF subfamily)
MAIFVARAHIRRRARRRWLSVFSPERTTSTSVEPPSTEARFALDEVYDLLAKLPVNHRMAFTLRYIEGLTLSDGAQACNVSLATFKRWVARAEQHFVEAARKRPALEPWLKDGTRWKHGS